MFLLFLLCHCKVVPYRWDSPLSHQHYFDSVTSLCRYMFWFWNVHIYGLFVAGIFKNPYYQTFSLFTHGWKAYIPVTDSFSFCVFRVFTRGDSKVLYKTQIQNIYPRNRDYFDVYHLFMVMAPI